MGMFVHGDRDEKAFYEEQSAMQTLGINGSALVAHYTDPIAPPNVKDVLLKTWAQDTEAMAIATIDAYYDDEDGWFSFPDGFGTNDPDKAVAHQVAYLNSPAEERL